MTADGAVEIAGVRVTHPERVLYPEQGVTKGDLAEYYAGVAEWMLPHVIHRPLAVVRCPRGREKTCFYQKHRGDGLDEAVGGVEVEEKDGTVATYLMIEDEGGLVALAQAGVLEIHPWGCRADRLERPDRLVIDLDPGEGVEWPAVVEAARGVGRRLGELGLTSFVRTTGGKGLHVVVPLERRAGWERLKHFARAIAEAVVEEEPERYTANALKREREGRIFVDWLRNARGATAIACYSTRARPGAPVATPLAWAELGSIEGGDAFDLGNVGRRLEALERDPWEGFFELRQSITQEMEDELGIPR